MTKIRRVIKYDAASGECRKENAYLDKETKRQEVTEA